MAAMSEETSSQPAPSERTAGPGTSGRGAASQGTSGQGTASQGTSGQGTTSQEASGQGTASQSQSQGASGQGTSGHGSADGEEAGRQAPPPGVWPSLRANDARALIAFLVDALGFQATVVYGQGSIVDHAELAWPPGGGIMLGSARPDKPSRVTEPGNFSAYVVTSDPDALHARAVAHGARVTNELHDTDYGSRDFAIEDPEGNHWTFGTYAGHPR